MKHVFMVLAAQLPSIVCFAGAVWLASYDKSGWGWLIFAGLFCSGVSIKTKG